MTPKGGECGDTVSLHLLYISIWPNDSHLLKSTLTETNCAKIKYWQIEKEREGLYVTCKHQQRHLSHVGGVNWGMNLLTLTWDECQDDQFMLPFFRARKTVHFDLQIVILSAMKMKSKLEGL